MFAQIFQRIFGKKVVSQPVERVEPVFPKATVSPRASQPVDKKVESRLVKSTPMPMTASRHNDDSDLINPLNPLSPFNTLGAFAADTYVAPKSPHHYGEVEDDLSYSTSSRTYHVDKCYEERYTAPEPYVQSSRDSDVSSRCDDTTSSTSTDTTSTYD